MKKPAKLVWVLLFNHFSLTCLFSQDLIRWDESAGGNGHYYQLVRTPVFWTEAAGEAASTQLLGVPGHLVTINSLAENNFIARNAADGNNVWIGLSDVTSEGNFQWVTGETVAFTRWETGEPTNNNGLEHYVELNAAGPQIGTWSDRVSTLPRSYIIEYDVTAALDVDGNGSVDALTDTLMLLRYAFGFSGSALTTGAVAPTCTRCTTVLIEEYLDSLFAAVSCDGGVVCGPGETLCGNTCADLATDENNCGGCGVVCVSGQVCQSGYCI